jgi:hypothetical protein
LASVRANPSIGFVVASSVVIATLSLPAIPVKPCIGGAAVAEKVDAG